MYNKFVNDMCSFILTVFASEEAIAKAISNVQALFTYGRKYSNTLETNLWFFWCIFYRQAPVTINLHVVNITLIHSMFSIYFHTYVNMGKTLLMYYASWPLSLLRGFLFVGHGMKNKKFVDKVCRVIWIKILSQIYTYPRWI